MWRGWSQGMSFGTNLGQNTIRKNNDKKNDRPKHPKLRRSYFLMWHSRREADHCADSAFPYLYYRRQHADCQAPEGIAIRRFLWYPYLQERRCSASAAVMLPFLGSPMCRALRGSSIFCRPPRVRVFLYMSYSRRYSVMEIWNDVLALLTLLVTVIIGTAKITWTLAQAIFRDSHRAKHDSKK